MTEKRVITDSATVTEVRTYNDLNQITENEIDDGTTLTTWTYTHDANGNMTGKTDGTDTWAYVWDEDNRLIRVDKNSVTQVEYEYDVFGRICRRSEGQNELQLAWDYRDVIKSVLDDGSGVALTRYYQPDSKLLTLERDQFLQVHLDALGSVRAITNSVGAVVAHYGYDAWGNLLPGSSALSDDFQPQFIGGLGIPFCAVSGLHYMRERWYSAELGRFLSRDPMKFISYPVYANPYAYALDAPNDLVDPMGLEPSPGVGDRRLGNPAGDNPACGCTAPFNASAEKAGAEARKKIMTLLSEIEGIEDAKCLAACMGWDDVVLGGVALHPAVCVPVKAAITLSSGPRNLMQFNWCITRCRERRRRRREEEYIKSGGPVPVNTIRDAMNLGM